MYILYANFDYIYEKHDDFLNVYSEIVDTLIEKAEHEHIIYVMKHKTRLNISIPSSDTN